VPNGSGEKAKGAILSRAVQYLQENEARNIEKWTLEKLLMDQAMGDLQAQLEEMRRLWEEERMARQRAEGELDVLRGLQVRNGAPAPPASSAAQAPTVLPSPPAAATASPKADATAAPTATEATPTQAQMIPDESASTKRERGHAEESKAGEAPAAGESNEGTRQGKRQRVN
jgi:transcriptional regulator CBF1